MNSATRTALRATVAAITAARCGLELDPVITGDLPAGHLAETAVAVAAGLLDGLPGDAGERVLRDLGLAAAGVTAQTPL